MASMQWRVCSTWKKKLCSAVLGLCLLSMSVFLLPSFHPKARKLYNSVKDRDTILFAKDTLTPLQDKNLAAQHTKSINRNVVETTNVLKDPSHKNKTIYGYTGHVQCSMLANQSSRGPIEADVDTVPSMSELEDELASQLQLGGHFVPTGCRPTQRVAIIIPFRDRMVHLKMFLRHMHPFLQRQTIEYYIVVVEQAEGDPFNRALLFNVGFYKMNKLHAIDCFIFHDIDLLPIDDRIMYLCHDQPLHLSMLVDTLGDKLLYDSLFGGVVALTPEMMTTVNGFSNMFYGWGGEDDDMSYRIRSHGYNIDRYSKNVSHYTMMKHAHEEDINQDKLNRKVEAGRGRIHEDGLNTIAFNMDEFQPLPLYTWIYIRPNLNTTLS